MVGKASASAGWEDVERLALAMPEAVEQPAYGNRAWRVRKKLFVWERPLRHGELEELGAAAPDGPILGAKVEHLMAKEALIADEPEVYFTTPHFDGYPSVLVRLDRIGLADLEEVIAEAWLAVAPKRLARAFLDARG
ncbi:MAG TPA: MmcQ/YjbR family DNA-binding protein [Solirubrobacterales bacterium]|nr:MmcQ/YjbR family DNA-binding protein [Solirubrobacterales bacterium]